ncbi:hypothetical protein [Algicella marina]|nr:hypothetical protein [Algicella marina]
MFYLMAETLKVATRTENPHEARLRPYRKRRTWRAPRWWWNRG